MAMQIRRTATPGNAPSGLAQGQLAVEMASDPPKLWVGVPASVDASGRRLLNEPYQGLAFASGGYANKFRNPGMDIWQRGNVVVANNTSHYTADGWQVFPIGSSVTVLSLGNSIGGSRSRNAMAIINTGNATLTALNLDQKIESMTSASLAGRQITVQFMIRNDTPNAITPFLQTFTPPAADDWSGNVEDLALTNLQSVPPNGGVTRVAYTFQASVNAVDGYMVRLGFPSGALTTSAHRVLITDADIRDAEGWPTGLTHDPPNVELRPRELELLSCRRYYNRWSATGSNMCIGWGIRHQQNAQLSIIPITVRMRPIAGTLTVSSVAGFTTGQTTNNVALSSVGRDGMDGISINFFWATLVTPTFIPWLVHVLGGHWMALSVEL